MDTDARIRKAIEQTMNQKGVSQADLARELGVTPQAVYPLLKGTRGKQPQSLLNVLEVLGLELTVQPRREVKREASTYLSLAGIFDDPTSPGDVSEHIDDYLGEGLEEEHQESGVRGR